MNDRTYLDPLRDAEKIVGHVITDLIATARAFDYVGQGKMGKSLGLLAGDLQQAVNAIREGSDMALRAHITGADIATHNMVMAAMAASKASAAHVNDDRQSESK